tara:strand:- start:1496 stop:2074 length:579 start_codon:yes stop_codon:yes gene_type:complete
MYTEKVEKALRAASTLHRDQVRKGPGNPPYVTHLFAAALIVSQYTSDEDVVVSTILHDTIEDTDYTLEELEEDFGSRIREIVQAVTEPKEIKDWSKRKDRYLKSLKSGPNEALLVAAADKIHNMLSIVRDFTGHEDKFVREFGGSLDERLGQYQNFGNLINSRVKNAIVHEFNTVFMKYKQFLVELETLQKK